ncbi:MAG TPA: hypothetical protein VK211_02545 [Kamptonema sp.]|nr:hypothetical protein [Kamptonema sp.]
MKVCRGNPPAIAPPLSVVSTGALPLLWGKHGGITPTDFYVYHH